MQFSSHAVHECWRHGLAELLAHHGNDLAPPAMDSHPAAAEGSLAGGCFQYRRLLEGMIGTLRKCGLGRYW